MEKIYQGESLNLVFRCRNKAGEEVEMETMDVSVLLRDSFGKVVYRFSTLNLPGVKKVEIAGNIVLCRLNEEEMSGLAGIYVIEVKVSKEDLVMIEMVKNVKIYRSVIGKEVEL